MLSADSVESSRLRPRLGSEAGSSATLEGDADDQELGPHLQLLVKDRGVGAKTAAPESDGGVGVTAALVCIILLR